MEDPVSSSSFFNPRKPLFWAVGVVGALAFFASGALAANALNDDGTSDGGSPANSVVVPNVGTAEDGRGSAPSTGAAYGPNDVITTGKGGADSASYPACLAPLPPGLLTATGLDLSKANFAPAFPTSGFSALRANIAVQGECDKDGKPRGGNLALDSAWTHDATGLEAYLSQVKTDKRIASVLRQDSASFWANGYEFHVGVNAFHILPADAGISRGMPSPAPQADPRAAEVLRELIAQIAPSVDQKCFWTMGSGDWSSLAAAGVGDPRPAIPAGFTPAEFSITTFTAPGAGCDTSIKPTEGFSLNAGWQKAMNSADFAYIGVSVFADSGSNDYPGQINEYGANWTNGTYQFGVYAKSAKPIGLDTIRAIARALDPQFNEQCLVTERELAVSELAGLGFNVARAPQDYKLVSSRLRANEIAAGCTKPSGFEPSYTLHWSFEKGADIIDASANRWGGASAGDGSGYQGPNFLNWTDARGTNYNVNAYSKGVNPTVNKDDLVAVARSMDPSFDLSKLKEDGGVKPLPESRPADTPKP